MHPRTGPALTSGLLALAVLAPAAAAAPVPDRVLAEVARPLDVAMDGKVVAWLHLPGAGRATELVIHDGRRVVRRLPAGRSGEGIVDNAAASVDVGRDARGRAVVVFTSCPGVEAEVCDVRVARAAGGPSKRLARVVGMPDDVAVGGGRVVWNDGDDRGKVQWAPLTGGPVRVATSMAGPEYVADLATDGRRVVAHGYTSDQPDGSNSDYEYSYLVKEAAFGSMRMRTLTEGGNVSFDGVALTSRGIMGLDSPRAFAELVGGRRTLRPTGMPTMLADATGEAAVSVVGEAIRGEACGLRLIDTDENPAGLTEAELQAVEDKADVPAPCRIVVSPRVRAERLLPPEITRSGRKATITRPVLSGGRVVRREAVRRAGIPVTVRDLDAKVVATLKTDAGGRVTLPPAARKRPNLLTARPGGVRVFASDDGR